MKYINNEALVDNVSQMVGALCRTSIEVEYLLSS